MSTEPKTKPTAASVAEFIAAVPDPRRRAEAVVIDAVYRRVTALEPKMWGPSLIGYGRYDYTYDSGRSGTMCRAGFSPRKAALTLYLGGNDEPAAQALYARLGKYSRGKGCLYIKRLDQVDTAVLEGLIALSWKVMNARYPG
jgi:hypothetical protein